MCEICIFLVDVMVENWEVHKVWSDLKEKSVLFLEER